MATKWVIHFSFGQQRGELLEDGLDDVWWECGHGDAPSHWEASTTPQMIVHPCPFYIRMCSLLAQALRLLERREQATPRPGAA
jgi:hypothetical protein